MNAEATFLSSVVVPAQPVFRGGDVYDLVSLDDVKLELEIDSRKHDDWLKKKISSASGAVRKFCNRTFQVQTYLDHYFAPRDPYPWQVPTGFQPLQLSKWPVASQACHVGTPPPLAPSLSATAGGILPAQRYYCRVTYVTPSGETAASLEANLAVPANMLPTVAAPAPDALGIATGWNCYLGSAAFGETLQNATPIGMDTNFTLSASGLLQNAAAVPPFMLVVENVEPKTAPPLSIFSTPLAEGPDFLIKRDVGELTRRFLDGMPRRWAALPTVVVYQAGFTAIPDDVQEACIDLVKARWFARKRDPMIKSENVEGVYQADYWFGTGPGGPGDLANNVSDRLERYRVPVIG